MTQSRCDFVRMTHFEVQAVIFTSSLFQTLRNIFYIQLQSVVHFSSFVSCTDCTLRFALKGTNKKKTDLELLSLNISTKIFFK